jgi:hypothetical protein
VNSRRKTPKTFAWISSENSASGQYFSDLACDRKNNGYEVRLVVFAYAIGHICVLVRKPAKKQ